MKRHRNDGLRKVCDCARRNWAKCPHPWHVNFQHNGTAIRKSLDKLAGKRITSKTDAEDAWEQIKIQLKTSINAGRGIQTTSPNGSLTLAKMLDRYQRDYLSRRPAADNTETQIAAITRTLLPFGDGARAFGEWKVSEVNEAALWAYRAARELKTVMLDKNGQPTRRYVGGAVTVNRDVQLLRRAFNWALAAMPGDVQSSPFKAGKPPKGLVSRESSRSRRLQEGEAERLLVACGASLRPLVEAALETGCRLGELLGLQWAEVNLREVRPEIRLPASKTKTRKDRTVPISARLRPILEMRRTGADGKEHEAAAYVFGHQATGERVKTIKTAWRLAMQRSKITDLHFHDLRREAASRWLDAGIRLSAVSKLLGHTTTEQTATYLACVLGAEHDAIEQFDQHRARLQESASEDKTGVTNGVEGCMVEDTSPQESSADTVVH